MHDSDLQIAFVFVFFRCETSDLQRLGENWHGWDFAGRKIREASGKDCISGRNATRSVVLTLQPSNTVLAKVHADHCQITYSYINHVQKGCCDWAWQIMYGAGYAVLCVCARGKGLFLKGNTACSRSKLPCIWSPVIVCLTLLRSGFCWVVKWRTLCSNRLVFYGDCSTTTDVLWSCM